jgi:hypothetical protein
LTIVELRIAVDVGTPVVFMAEQAELLAMKRRLISAMRKTLAPIRYTYTIIFRIWQSVLEVYTSRTHGKSQRFTFVRPPMPADRM